MKVALCEFLVCISAIDYTIEPLSNEATNAALATINEMKLDRFIQEIVTTGLLSARRLKPFSLGLVVEVSPHEPHEGLYDLCALAFGTTRDDAKTRLLAAMYGKRGEPLLLATPRKEKR